MTGALRSSVRVVALSAAVLAATMAGDVVATAAPGPARPATIGTDGDAGATGRQSGAERLFSYARRLEREGDLAGALDEYTQLVERFPGSELAAESLVRMVRGYRELGRREEALSAANRLVDEFTGTIHDAAGQILAGEIRMEATSARGQLEEIRANLRRVPRLFSPDTHPDIAWRSRAYLRSAEIGYRLGEFDVAAGEFLAAFETEPPSRWTARARVGLARVFLLQGEWRAATELLQAVAGRADEETVQAPTVEARDLLGLVHRLFVRGEHGRDPWRRARRLEIRGAVLDEPNGIAVNDDGRVVLVDEGASVALILDPEGAVTTRLTASDPRRTLWDRYGGGHVVKERSIVQLGSRDRRTFVQVEGDDRDELDDLNAAAASRSGHWFVIDSTERLLEFDAEGSYLRAVVSGESDRDPVDVGLDERDRLYVLDRDSEFVLRFAGPGATAETLIRDDWEEPETLAVDQLGNVYVLDRDARRVHVYGRDGRSVATLGPRFPGGIELDEPRDLDVDRSGRVFIVDRDLGEVIVVE